MKRILSLLLFVLAACQATPEGEQKRWSRNQTDAGMAQTTYPNIAPAISKLLSDATVQFNAANGKTGNAQLQDMQQANKVIEQILYPIRDYERELKDAQNLMGQVPTASTVLGAAISNAKTALLMVNNPDPNVAIGAFRGAYDQLKPVVDWAEQVRSGKNPPMPTVPGVSAMVPGVPGVTGVPGVGVPMPAGTPGVPGAAPGAAPGADPGGAIPTGIAPSGPGEGGVVTPGAPGAPGAPIPGAVAPGGPGGN